MANDSNSSKNINIISNEKITNFSDFLKASNLTSKKDVLFKGLSNNMGIGNKTTLNTHAGAQLKINGIQSSSVERGHVKKETVSDTEGSDAEDLPKDENVSSKTNKNEKKNITDGKHENGHQKIQLLTVNKLEDESASDSSESNDDSNKKNNSIKTEVSYSEGNNNKPNIKKSDDTSDDDSSSSSNYTEINSKTSKAIIPHDNKTATECNKRLSEFITKNDLKSVNTVMCNVSGFIEADCDILLVQIPKSIDPNILLNQEIDLENQETKIKTNYGSFVLNFEHIKQEPSILVTKTSKGCSAQKIHPSGIITVHKSLKRKRKSDANMLNQEEEQLSVPYPIGLKMRHPIFGFDYEEKIHLNDDIQRRLSDAINTSQKKVKKRRQSTVNLSEDYNETKIFASMFEKQETVDEPQTRKKKKKKSKNRDTRDEFDDVDAVPDIFNQPEINYEELNDQKMTDINVNIANSTLLNNHVGYFENDVSEINFAGTVKKEKKNMDNDASRLILEELEMEMKNETTNLENSNLSESMCKKKKKKKKKKSKKIKG